MEIEVFTSIADAPLDSPPPDVGDQGATPGKDQLAAARQLGMIIPFTREIRGGSVGWDVVGAKRALWRARRLKLGGLTPVFGPIAVRQLKLFQKTHGLAADGVIGPATLKKLGPHFDRYAFWLYEGYRPGQNPVEVKRARMVAYLTWGYNQRVLIHYQEFRPMTYMNDLYRLPVWEDCSTFYTKAAKAAGWQDPNGMGYDGAGNTSTLAVHGRQISLQQAQPGDAVLYRSPAHVAGYVGGGRVISHGGESGPSLTSVYYRLDLDQVRTYL